MSTFYVQAIRDLPGIDPSAARVLDFGCGQGGLVGTLVSAGVDAYGCDMARYVGNGPRLRAIETPYRLPFDSGSFDVVVSVSVLEHVTDHAQAFREIARVLKRGGMSMHQYPAKWYLPSEPHIKVPLVAAMWPRVPMWWLQAWALAGVRAETQAGMGWHEVVTFNSEACQHWLRYYPERDLLNAASVDFESVEMPMDYFLRNTPGGAAKLYRKMPSKPLAWLLRKTRTAFLVTRKG